MLKRFLRNRKGSAAVEFAFVAPIVLILYFGMVETTQAMLAYGRVSHVATAVGDLVTQQPALTRAQIQDIFDISDTIVKPLPTADLGIRVTGIQIDAGGNAVSKWVESTGPIGDLPDALDDVPDDMKIAGSFLVRTDTTYEYNSFVQGAMRTLKTPIRLGNSVFLSPRRPGPITVN